MKDEDFKNLLIGIDQARYSSWYSQAGQGF
jgi:hypothetical protein